MITYKRNWQIRRLRVAYDFLKHENCPQALHEIDAALEVLGAESHTARYERTWAEFHDEAQAKRAALDNGKKL